MQLNQSKFIFFLKLFFIFSTNIYNIIDYVDAQKEEMQSIYSETMAAKNAFNANYKDNKTVNTEMYGAADIEKDYNKQIEKYGK